MCGVSHARFIFFVASVAFFRERSRLFCFAWWTSAEFFLWFERALIRTLLHRPPTPPAILAHIHAHQILKICLLGLARSICSGIVVASNTQTPAGQTQSKRVQQHMDGGGGDLLFSLIQFWARACRVDLCTDRQFRANALNTTEKLFVFLLVPRNRESGCFCLPVARV